MAEGNLKTVWEHHRENRIPYPENKPDWVEYAMWYRLCDTMNGYVKSAEGSKTAITREFSDYMAAFYGRRANRFLEGHIRAAILEAEQGMPPEAIAETNGVGPNDPVCVAKWIWDNSPSQSPLPEFCGKEPYSGSGDTCAEMKYFGYEQIGEHTDPAVIRQRMDRCLKLWRRFPDDLSLVEMREWVILKADCPWVWLRKLDRETSDELMAEVAILRRESSCQISDGKTNIGRYLELRRKAKAAFLRGDWQEAMRLVNNSPYCARMVGFVKPK
jgi:hypothetical protein